MTRQTWIDAHAALLIEALRASGVSVSGKDAADLIATRVAAVARDMNISETAARRYVDDNAIKNLADVMLSTLADELPGVDVFSLPRTADVPFETLGRCVAALAEAIQIDLLHEDSVHGAETAIPLVQAVSTLGLLLAEGETTRARTGRSDGIAAPPALLARVARYLGDAADRVTSGATLPAGVPPDNGDSLAAMFRRDTIRLRTILAGPLTE